MKESVILKASWCRMVILSCVSACIVIVLSSAAFAQRPSYAIDGTTGAPLGGIGCGAIKFCSYTGEFTATWRTPCALDNFQPLVSTQFQFFSKSGTDAAVTTIPLVAVQAGGRADDDAVYPVQYANFGTQNGVSTKLTAFAPFNLSAVDLMCYPYAFYQIQVTNTNAASIDVALAFQARLTAGTAMVAGKGIKNDDGTLKRAIYASSDDPSAVISVGPSSDNGFLTTGQCGNTISGTTNKVAVKVTLAAGQSRLIKFVYAWCNSVTGFEGNHDGMFYYLNKFTNAGDVADTGLAHFDQFRDNAVSLVTRMRASNFPDWIKNQALVSLCNLTNNSMYRKDGRYAHTEGEWSTNGTNDQMWHARQIYTMLVPSLNWQELQYWARTQKTAATVVGQIHHDIDSCSDVVCGTALSRNMAYMCSWDDASHGDYRDIDLWVDLNCGFIISVYETFIATADTAKLSYFWPYVKKAGQRILSLVASNGLAGYPFLFQGTENSYDAGQVDANPYNASLSSVTYKTLSVLSEIKGEPALKKIYDSAFVTVNNSFKSKYLNGSGFPTLRVEATMVGQWLSYFLKFGDLYDTASINFAFSALNGKYNPLVNGLYASTVKTYAEWAPYMVSHYAGLCLEAGKLNEWKAIQYDWYQRIFNNRNLVYNQPLDIPAKVTTPTYLATDPSGYDQYISTPAVWRNYYTLVGYQRNKYTGELWLEPIIPDTMNHVMTDALIFPPEGWARVNCQELNANFLTQRITFVPDNPIQVSGIYLKDKKSANVYVWVNDVAIESSKITRIGSGYQKEIKVDWSGTVPAVTGLKVFISDVNVPDAVIDGKQLAMSKKPVFSKTAKSFSITTCNAASYDIKVFSINGKMLKHFQGFGAARYRFGPDVGQAGAQLYPGVFVVRLESDKKVFNTKFLISR
jgi:uncharacterized protein (DUF608 family)